MLASASDDNSVKIWNHKTGKLIKTLYGHKYGINKVIFSPDSRFIATASFDNTVRLWSTETYEEVYIDPIKHKAAVNYICFSPDSSKIVSASDDNTALITSLSLNEDRILLDGHYSFVNYSIFSPDGKYVLTSSGDTIARIWSSTKPAEPLLLEGHKAWISFIKYSKNGDIILTASGDGEVKVWYVKKDYKVYNISLNEILDSQDQVFQIIIADISDDLRYVYVVLRYMSFDSDDYWFIVVLDLKAKKPVMLSVPKKGYVDAAVFSDDHLCVLLVLRDNSLRCYDIANDCELSCFHFDYQPTAISNHQNSVAVGDEYGRVHIFNIKNKRVY